MKFLWGRFGSGEGVEAVLRLRFPALAFSWDSVGSQDRGVRVGFEEPHLRVMFLGHGTGASPNLPYFCVCG